MFRKIFISLTLLIFTLAPVYAAAEGESTSTDMPEIIGGSLLPGTSDDVESAIEGQTAGDGEEALTEGGKKLQWLQQTFLRNVLDLLIGFAAALSVVFIIIGSYQYLTAGGNDERIKQAHKTITWSLLGLFVTLLAFAVVQIVVNIDFDPAESSSSLLAADAADILPFTKDSWEGSEAIKNLPSSDFKEEFLPIIARFMVYGIAFVAFLMFFFAGAWLVVGWGEEEDIKKAKNIIIWGVAGLAYAAASYIIVKGILGVDFGDWDKGETSTATEESSSVGDFGDDGNWDYDAWKAQGGQD